MHRKFEECICETITKQLPSQCKGKREAIMRGVGEHRTDEQNPYGYF